MPLDQRADDGQSLCFDGERLTAPLEILGGTRLRLSLSCDREEGMIAVRLCDVAPDGTSSRITYGLLNLQHRHGHARAERLVPGRRYDVEVKLKDCCYEIPAGHCLRVAVSTAYWPLAMPVGPSSTVTVHEGALHLPLRTPSGAKPAELGQPKVPPALAATVIVPPERGRLRMSRDLAAGTSRVDVVRNLGAVKIEDVAIELKALGSEVYEITPEEPSRVRSETHRLAEFRRGGWHAAVETRSVLTMEDTNWRLKAWIDARTGSDTIYTRDWDLLIPRSTAE
jgi:hypothetical protein